MLMFAWFKTTADEMHLSEAEDQCIPDVSIKKKNLIILGLVWLLSSLVFFFLLFFVFLQIISPFNEKLK